MSGRWRMWWRSVLCQRGVQIASRSRTKHLLLYSLYWYWFHTARLKKHLYQLRELLMIFYFVSMHAIKMHHKMNDINLNINLNK